MHGKATRRAELKGVPPARQSHVRRAASSLHVGFGMESDRRDQRCRGQYILSPLECRISLFLMQTCRLRSPSTMSSMSSTVGKSRRLTTMQMLGSPSSLSNGSPGLPPNSVAVGQVAPSQACATSCTLAVKKRKWLPSRFRRSKGCL